jgi:hypothetical protein
VHHVGHLPELYEDAQSEKYLKKLVFVTSSGSLVHFDRLFGFLIFLKFTLMMVATAIETCW